MSGEEYYQECIKIPGLLYFLKKRNVVTEFKLSCINYKNSTSINKIYTDSFFMNPYHIVSLAFIWVDANRFLETKGYAEINWAGLYDDFYNNYERYKNLDIFRFINFKII